MTMETSNKPLLFSEIKENKDSAILTTNPKFNQWFSRYSPEAKKPKFGGMVRKSVIFVTGSSGAGKTTTLANIMEWTPNISSVFYARECDLDEIKDQLSPFEVTNKKALFSDVNTFPTFKDFMNYLHEAQPELVAVDSLQAIASAEYRSMKLNKDDAAEYIRQELTTYIKQRAGVLFLIGHNTKEGEFAGKNTNMQMVDAHMVLEYDKKTNVRKIYWGQKNRKGPMTSMYYEIHDGEILYFNPDEYKVETPSETEPVVVSKKVCIPQPLSPKNICKAFIEQFKTSKEYESFKTLSEKIIKDYLYSYKKSYDNEKAETHAYFDALKAIHSLAENKGLI